MPDGGSDGADVSITIYDGVGFGWLGLAVFGTGAG